MKYIFSAVTVGEHKLLNIDVGTNEIGLELMLGCVTLSRDYKENAEIPKLREKFAEADAEKVELRRELEGRTDELEKTIADYSVKIGKLNAIIVELERNNAVTTKLESENEMFPEVTVISKEMISGDGNDKNTIDSNANTMNSEAFGNIQVSDSVADQFNNEVGRAVASGDALNDNFNFNTENKETDDFLDEVLKKRVSDEIRKRKQEKKLQGELVVQESSLALIPVVKQTSL
ncbi:unnamed protein product [Rhizophagus irregularis]|nr:unnamed protein product [Rhizophagus irregularis]